MSLRATSSGGISVNSSYPREPPTGSYPVSIRESRVTMPWTMKTRESRESSAMNPREFATKTLLDPSPYMTLAWTTESSMPQATVSAFWTWAILSRGLTPPGSISIWTIETGERFRSDMPPGKLPALTAEATVSARSSSDEASFV